MNKSELKAIFINAKATDAKYIGVSIQTEGSSQPEIIINPNPNFDAKFDYYMEAYDDDLILIAAKGKKDIRITAAGEGYKYDTLEAVYIKGMSYEDIVRETGCGRNSPKKWCRVMIQRLSIKLFGAKAIENDKNGVKTG